MLFERWNVGNHCRKYLMLILLLYLTGVVVFNIMADANSIDPEARRDQEIRNHNDMVRQYYEKRRLWTTSNLGSILFKNIDPILYHHISRERKTFTILLWNNTVAKAPLRNCDVKNCVFVDRNGINISDADAILFHVGNEYPEIENRNIRQRWVLYSDKSPVDIFYDAKPDLVWISNTFNWTMTYRSDSDVPVPYGRTLPLPTPISYTDQDWASLVPYWNEKRTEVLLAIYYTDCDLKYNVSSSYFLDQLRAIIKVDIFTRCPNGQGQSCEEFGANHRDCQKLSRYYFYLAFENSLCRQYLTHKLFHTAYDKGAIPIILGAPLSDCQKLLPPGSFLHIEEYISPKTLAREIERIMKNYVILLSYHKWRLHFEVVNEHGFYGNSKSERLCRLCEALNFNDGETSIYDKDMLRLHFDPSLSCVV